MDAKDLKILSLLQQDATLSLAEVAAEVGLSSTPAWRRIQKLEQDGYIRARVALLDREKMNCAVSVFVAIRTRQHDMKWLELFQAAVDTLPEIVEAYRLSGDIDYMLRVVVPDIAAYDAFYKRLIALVPMADVSSSFSMQEMKYTTALPTHFTAAALEE